MHVGYCCTVLHVHSYMLHSSHWQCHCSVHVWRKLQIWAVAAWSEDLFCFPVHVLHLQEERCNKNCEKKSKKRKIFCISEWSIFSWPWTYESLLDIKVSNPDQMTTLFNLLLLGDEKKNQIIHLTLVNGVEIVPYGCGVC